MKLGCMLYSLGRSLQDGSLNLSQALSLIKETGGEGVDVMAAYVRDYANTELRQMVADSGLVTCCYIAGANFVVTDAIQQAEAVESVRRAIDDAQEVGAEVMLITTGGCPEGMQKSEARKLVANGLSVLLPHAKGAGITLTIEDVGGPQAPYRLGAEVLECCELAGPELMITYDSGNMVIGDEDPVEALAVMRLRVVYAHAKDWELLPPEAETNLISPSGKRYVGTVVGQGVIDHVPVFAALRAMHYDGFVSFEYEGRGDPVEATRAGMRYLGQLVRDYSL